MKTTNKTIWIGKMLFSFLSEQIFFIIRKLFFKSGIEYWKIKWSAANVLGNSIATQKNINCMFRAERRKFPPQKMLEN